MPTERVVVEDISVRAYRIPTRSAEADGTFEWTSTTLIVVYVKAGGKTGMGYSYTDKAAAVLIQDILRKAVVGLNVLDIPSCWQIMCQHVRNMGRSGIAASAIAAIDIALWDVKAKLFDLPLISLLGKTRQAVPVYGSGGFTTYSPKEIIQQIDEWKEQGITLFKIKIGRDHDADIVRSAAASKALPANGRLFVDANGAYQVKEALVMAEKLADFNVAWFEEPVTSDNSQGLHLLRERAPACMAIAAGEYGYTLDDFRPLLKNEAVDVLQIDATRCMGVTGFLKAAALAEGFHIPQSSHCAPSLHIPLMAHITEGLHIEYFYDHARIEDMLFEGIPKVKKGLLEPQDELSGFGWVFKSNVAEAYAL